MEYIISTTNMPDHILEVVAPWCNAEVVRCRDCRYMHTVKSWLLGMDVDECWLHADPESGALGKEMTKPDGFCAWGERKDDVK